MAPCILATRSIRETGENKLLAKSRAMPRLARAGYSFTRAWLFVIRSSKENNSPAVARRISPDVCFSAFSFAELLSGRLSRSAVSRCALLFDCLRVEKRNTILSTLITASTNAIRAGVDMKAPECSLSFVCSHQ